MTLAELRARALVDRYRDRLEGAEIDAERLEAALVEAIEGHAADLRVALDESVRLQTHYAHALNMYDGGRRLLFATADAWLARLVVTRTLPRGSRIVEREP